MSTDEDRPFLTPGVQSFLAALIGIGIVALLMVSMACAVYISSVWTAN